MSSAQLPPDPASVPREIRAVAPRKPQRDAPMPTPSRRILGMRIDATRYEAVSRQILERGRNGLGGMVCVASVHMVMESWDDPKLRRVVNGAEIVTPDGVPLVWGLRRLGVPGARRVYGPSLMDRICADAAREGVPIGLYGGTPRVLESLVRRLGARHRGLRVALRIAPPFREPSTGENLETVAAIRESGAQVLFIGLGCPKQERWMAAHRDSLSCPMVGVGAAFDFLAGVKPQAPRWMQAAGLEWLFRLICEPRRLWRRYLIHNPRFVLRFGWQLGARLLGRVPRA